jgi:hypothetical protein
MDVPQFPISQYWATTQNNLGAALKEQGIRSTGEDGRRLLAEAVSVYEDALSIFSTSMMTYHASHTTDNLEKVRAALKQHSLSD